MPLASGTTYIHGDVISPFSPEAVVPGRYSRYSIATSPASTVIGTTQIYIYPIAIHSPFQVAYAWALNGTTLNGNFDIGIYDSAGNLLQSTGATAAAGSATDYQSVSMSRLLLPGRYLLAYSTSSATHTVFAILGGNANIPTLTTHGFSTMASATPCPLPNSITQDSAFGGVGAPVFGLANSRGV